MKFLRSIFLMLIIGSLTVSNVVAMQGRESTQEGKNKLSGNRYSCLDNVVRSAIIETKKQFKGITIKFAISRRSNIRIRIKIIGAISQKQFDAVDGVFINILTEFLTLPKAEEFFPSEFFSEDKNEDEFFDHLSFEDYQLWVSAQRRLNPDNLYLEDYSFCCIS